MNVENMLKVADAIESKNAAGVKLKFDMLDWYKESHCGTAACVAGTAVILSGDYEDSFRLYQFSIAGQKFLGVTDEEADHLFMGKTIYNDANDRVKVRSISLSTIQRKKKLVPDALRWMTLNKQINWWKGLEAAKCVADQRSPGTSEPEIVTA